MTWIYGRFSFKQAALQEIPTPKYTPVFFFFSSSTFQCFSSFPRRRTEPLLRKRTSLFLGWPAWTTKFLFKWNPRFSTVLIHLRSRNFPEPTAVKGKSTAWSSQRNLIALFWFKWNTTLASLCSHEESSILHNEIVFHLKIHNGLTVCHVYIFSWSTQPCCIIDGYYCFVVDRHCFFLFCKIVFMYCM